MRPSTSSASPGFPAQLSGIPRRDLLRQRLPGKENGLFRSAAAGKQGGAASTIYSAPIERGELCPVWAPGNRGPRTRGDPPPAGFEFWRVMAFSDPGTPGFVAPILRG